MRIFKWHPCFQTPLRCEFPMVCHLGEWHKHHDKQACSAEDRLKRPARMAARYGYECVGPHDHFKYPYYWVAAQLPRVHIAQRNACLKRAARLRNSRALFAPARKSAHFSRLPQKYLPPILSPWNLGTSDISYIPGLCAGHGID